MFGSRQTSPRGEAQVSRPDPDSDSTSAARNRRKRSRLDNDREEQNDPLPAACDQCRLRKVRCDRLQPECSNCRKGGFECNSSNTLKRVNHMKQLRDDFSDVMKQLNDVGHTLGVLTEITRQITSRPCPHATHPPYYTPQSNHTSPDALPLSAAGLLDFVQQPSQDDHRASFDPRATNMPPSETIELDHGGERLYSYPAPLVLMKSLLHQAKGLLADSDQQGEGQENRRTRASCGLQDPMARATMQRKLDDFPFNSPYQDFIPSGDTSPITTPPRLMVNLFVDGYLRNINTRTPIFNESKLHNAIDAHYSDKQLQDSRARALILNNIILLELSLEIQTGRASRSTSRVPNDDILPSFLRNCDRAISNLGAFMSPNIVSLQALMTLTLAAQEFYSDATAERVCQAACQVGRLMGIHRLEDRRQSEGEDTSDTQGRIFRILYAMDKQRVFMTGQPCDLHLFDSDQHIGPGRSEPDNDHPISEAFDHLMTIWEEIYLNLYSPRALRASTDTRLRQMRLVTGSLERFAQVHAKLLSPTLATNVEDEDLSRIELQYGYQVSQILVLRSDQDNEQSQSKMRDLARLSLRLILEVRKPPLTTARFALLARLFRRYPMVGFVELVAFRLRSSYDDFDVTTALLADVSLLREVCEQLEIMQYDNLSHIFYARLSKGLVWALDTLEALVEVLIKPSPRPQAVQTGFSQQPTVKDNRRPESSRNKSVAVPRSPTPDIFDAASRGPPSRGSQDFSRLRSSRPDDKDFGGHVSSGSRSRHAEITNFGFFTPDPERVEMISAPLSPVYQPSNSAFPAAHAPLELGSGPLSGNGNWNFNLDFLQGAFTQGHRWD
ncbi:hypothetical protein FHL15_007841 [Xylaria flabelliformis]|uniref:Zn(2)-C6 fungal-type domain-containing protein n=1 Tax=Xylaria flabelliformis TaxID=2512241 RepID=A0A553HTF8_9PEZI|nr:hypothetical protein FHL15_007841 [Xylaria flabelliformis]